MKHETHKTTLTLASAAVSTGAIEGIGDFEEKTIFFECPADATWNATVRVLGKVRGGTKYVHVGYVSGSGAKTLAAEGAILVPESVDSLKVEATAYNGTTGVITARFAGLKSRTS